jgi:hypothetical protein
MATLTRTAKSRRTKSKPAIHRTSRGTSLLFLEESPTALSRSTSLDTIAEHIPQRVRLVPRSAPRRLARIGIELPEGTVVRLMALDDQNVIVDTVVDGWLPAGTHELADLCLPNGAYKLRLETPTTWCIAGIMIG